MSTTLAMPQTVRDHVHRAVRNGAWAPADVVATVTADTATTRAEVLATLWDLVDEGHLVYDASTPFPEFRPSYAS